MYEEFFSMSHTPFIRDVPANLFRNPQMDDAIARLSYAARCQLFAVLTSGSGCGKSTLLRNFVQSLASEKYVVVYLSDSKLTPRWFYSGILSQLGIEARFYRGDAKRQLQKEVEMIRSIQHKKVVVILDEAHLLEKETIEEFRFMLNYRFDSMSPVALILSGQNELLDKLKLQCYAAVLQRIDIFCVLTPLDRADTEKYIAAHLEYSGVKQPIFTDRAMDEIHTLSAGIPRIVNRICEKSLMYSAQQRKHLIDEHTIHYIHENEMLGGNKA